MGLVAPRRAVSARHRVDTAASDAVLALIGAEWLTIADGSGRRRHENPADPVRIELETAFRFDV